MAWTDPPTKLANDLFTSAEFNALVRDNTNWLKDQTATKHGVWIQRSLSTTFNNGIATEILFNVDVEDTDNYHATAGGNLNRVTVPTGLGGIYHATFYIRWDTTSPGGNNFIGIAKNGALIGRQYLPAVAFASGMVSVAVPLADGDFISAVVYQASGANIVLSPVAASGLLEGHSPSLLCYKVA